ncbi:DUF3108 domain-containing protein [Thiomicrospira sp. R3]|uniref:DUF3108 domain-containing protein n=1 Tax=Thiomicrospira sp. R3 TaxID=3035472 RepID=UPI00259B1DE0|nr:DUF3108 domain-containing protein [Thiomicrospira sp. R3]WFE68736.1 DUF3108 domain-containing protein [Thiomicrospira sp. R3]
MKNLTRPFNSVIYTMINTHRFPITLAFICTTLFTTLNANALTPFEASYKIEAFGLTIGRADHSLTCKNQQCDLTSHATPTGLARRLIGEEGHERVQLALKDNVLYWLSYENKTIKIRSQDVVDQVFVSLNPDTLTIENLERNQSWAYDTNTFDPLSMAYALQHRLLNNQPIDTMTLQEEKRQRLLTFNDFGEVLLSSAFKSRLKTNHYVADTPEYKVSIWLATDLNLFPAQVEIYDKKRRRGMTLSLLKRPTFH